MVNKLFEMDTCLDDVILEMEHAQNLLICLNEFLDDEGFAPNKNSMEEIKYAGVALLERLPTHLPLLYCAIEKITREREHLIQINDKIYASADQIEAVSA